MRYDRLRRRAVLPLALILLVTACLAPITPGILTARADGEISYVMPAYAVDFSSHDTIQQCYDAYHLTPVLQDGSMRLEFDDNGNGICDDPYLSLSLPTGVDSTVYHYMALLVRTDKYDLRGELRFRTQTTGNDYPCQPFQYEETDDWQLIIVDLTDRATMIYASAGMVATGEFTNIRLDMFNNDCPSDTLYEIRAYGLYDNAEDAATFIRYTTPAETEPEPLPDFSHIWRGEAYGSPALRLRMRWLSYGFSGTAPIDSYLAAGYGGVVSNVNFTPAYLRDDREFELLAKVYDYASGFGMTAWIYDEYQWPSGKAFGQVLEGHDELQATGVEHHRLTGNNGLAQYTCTGQDIRILRADLTDASGSRTLSLRETDVASISEAATGSWTLDVYVLRLTYSGTENPADFSTLRHVDLLNPEAVARFLSLTHERYRDKMGEAFKNVEAFFTDEPQLGNRGMRSYVVWTSGLEEKFRAEYGYEIHLPSLFSGETDADRLCRMQYYRLVAKLFRESYIEQISAWCRANGVESSGHLLFEENMNDHIETYGGDFLRVVGGMTIPGVDLLWVDPVHLMTENYIGSAIGIRYVASAAKAAGGNRVMAEFNPNAVGALSAENPLFDCVGGVSLTRLLGVTDYTVINPQNDLTPAASTRLNLYVGRLNALLEGMEEAGQVAVFYPIATVQALHDADTAHGSESGNRRSEADRLDAKYQSLCLGLLENDFLYSVLDDEALSAATVATDGCLSVGSGTYRVVIVPYTQYISANALRRLVQFKLAGGTVLFMGGKPNHGLTAAEDAEIAALLEQFEDAPVFSGGVSQIKDLLSAALRRPVAIERGKSVISGDFVGEGCLLTYLANTSANESPVTIRFADGYTGQVTIYRPLTGGADHVTVGNELSLHVSGYEAVLILREDVADHRGTHTPLSDDTETTTSVETEPNSQTSTENDILGTDTTTSRTETDTAPTGKSGCASSFPSGISLLVLIICGTISLGMYARNRSKSTFL